MLAEGQNQVLEKNHERD